MITNFSHSNNNILFSLKLVMILLFTFAGMMGSLVPGLLYVIALLIYAAKKLRISGNEILLIILILIFTTLSVLFSDNLNAISSTIFYFSFIPIYIILKDSSTSDIIFILKFLMISMFVFCLTQHLLYNFFGFKYHNELSHLTSYFHGFQISLGLTYNHSASSVAMVICLILFNTIYSENNNILWKYYFMTFFVLLVTYSNASAIIFLIYLIYFLFNKTKFISGFLIIILFSLIIIIANIYNYSQIQDTDGSYIFSKYTLDYFLIVMSQKLILLSHFINSIDIFRFFYGTDGIYLFDYLYTSSDFALVYILKGMGFIRGLCLLLVPIILFGLSKKVFFLFLFYILSWMHYPALAGPFGSVLLAIFLLTYNEVKNRNV